MNYMLNYLIVILVIILMINVSMIKLFYLTVIALLCTVPICGQNTRKRLLVKFESHLITHRRIFGLSNRSSASDMYANYNT